MGALTGSTVASTYKDLTVISGGGAGVTSSLLAVTDGNGTVLPYKISSTIVQFDNVGFAIEDASSTYSLKITTGSTLTADRTLTINTGDSARTLTLDTDFTVSDAITASSTTTLTNKTISLTSNTVTGTLAEFNTAVTDANFASIAGTETLTNKTLTAPIIATISNSGTITIPTGTDTLVGKATTDTLTNKSIDLTNNTLVGSVSEFNTALESADFYTTGGTDVTLADGGTGASLADPNADTIMFWDDSAGAVTWLTVGSGLTITDTELTGAGATAASQAEMESATDTSKMVTPGRQQYHPGHPKAWVMWEYSGGTPAATVSYNVSSLTDSGTGSVKINFTTAFSTANYAASILKRVSSGFEVVSTDADTTTSSCKINVFDTSNGAADHDASAIFCGDQ